MRSKFASSSIAGNSVDIESIGVIDCDRLQWHDIESLNAID